MKIATLMIGLMISSSFAAQAAEFMTADYHLLGCEDTCSTQPASALQDSTFKRMACDHVATPLISIEKTSNSIVLVARAEASSLHGFSRELSTYRLGTHQEQYSEGTSYILDRKSLTEIDNSDPEHDGDRRTVRYEIQDDGSLLMKIDSRLSVEANNVKIHTTASCHYKADR